MNGENELPEGWSTAILGDLIIDIQPGFACGEHNRESEGIPHLRPMNVSTDGKIDLTVVKYIPSEKVNSDSKILKFGDVLFNNTNSTELVGKTAFYNLKESHAFSNHMTRIRCNPKILYSPYCALYIHELWREGYFGEHCNKHVSQSSISRNVLAETLVNFPPLAEQRRIVAAVEALLARVNTSRERLDRVPGLLKAFRQAVLAAACSGRLTEGWREEHPGQDIRKILSQVHVTASKTGRVATDNVIPGVCILSVGNPETSPPSGWAWVPLLKVARLESGHTPSIKHPEYWEGNIPWIGIQDARIHHGGYIEETHRHVSQSGLNHSAARLLPPNTVCLSRTASVGYVVIMKNQMATSQDFVNWICSEAILPKFLMYALMAEGDDIRRFGRGTTHTTIYFPEVKALHICLPTPPEQKEIIRRIESLFAFADRIEQRIVTGNDRADRLTQAILAKAFRGELMPTEAELARRERREYEPASVLLERVKKEKIGKSTRK